MTPVLITAWVSDLERPVLAAVADQLGEALCDEGHAPWPVRIDRQVARRADGTSAPVILGSMLADLLPHERTLAEIAADWTARLNRLAPEVRARFVLCNVFRAVRDARVDRGLLERIRRLDMMAVELSHEYDLPVVDLDRTLTFFGAEVLGTDYTLRGRAAAEVAAHAIVTVLLDGDLGGIVSTERLAAAAQRHGGLLQLGSAVERRLASPTQAPNGDTLP